MKAMKSLALAVALMAAGAMPAMAETKGQKEVDLTALLSVLLDCSNHGQYITIGPDLSDLSKLKLRAHFISTNKKNEFDTPVVIDLDFFKDNPLLSLPKRDVQNPDQSLQGNPTISIEVYKKGEWVTIIGPTRCTDL